VRAYRDALRLYFAFLADSRRRPPADLRLADLDADGVLAFLGHLEARRGNAAATRNCRLAALRALFRHLLRHDPVHADLYHRVLSLPPKKTRTSPAAYLEPEDVRLLLAQPDLRSASGARDRALLLFLYNTGARVGEALSVRPQDLDLSRPAQVRLRGKGGKDRLTPLWTETVATLRRLLAAAPPPGEPVFRNTRGGPLTRDGVAYILRKHLRRAREGHAAVRADRLTPHMLRHSCAVALLQAGIDVTVIRDYLGHASIATTSRYLATNLRMKREVLDAFWRRAGLRPANARPWQPGSDVLRFLASL
jgi:site-specific recombinase XerD